jgi:hypothetical protein
MILPDMFNPDGSLNEDALNERARRIKARQQGATMSRPTGIPGVDALHRKHRNQRIKFFASWLFRAAVVVGLVCIVVELKK